MALRGLLFMFFRHSNRACFAPWGNEPMAKKTPQLPQLIREGMLLSSSPPQPALAQQRRGPFAPAC